MTAPPSPAPTRPWASRIAPSSPEFAGPWASRTAPLLAGGLAALYAVTFGLHALLRTWHFHNRSFDLAVVVRLLWGLRRGSFHEVFTDQPWIAYHFEPILLPLALLDGLVPTAEALLLLQTLALALTAWPSYRLGARHLGGPLAGAGGAALALLFPALGQVNLFEVHPVAFAVAPGLALIDALETRHLRRAAICAALVISCREDGFVFVALALLSTGPLTRRRIVLALLGFVAYVLYALVIVPRLGTQGSVRAHFGALGSSPAEILRRLFTDPSGTLQALLTPRAGRFLLQLLGPVAFLPLLAPRRALPSAFTVALGLLSPFFSVEDSHYTALAIPGVLVGALVGAARLRALVLARAPRLAAAPAALLGVATLAGQVGWGAWPGMGGFYGEDYAGGPRVAALEALVQPMHARPEAAVSVPIDVLAHVSRRARVALFPRGLGEADFALIDLAGQVQVGEEAARHSERQQLLLRRALSAGLAVLEQRGPLVLLGRSRGPTP
jgi:uncharacterized membrane protein